MAEEQLKDMPVSVWKATLAIFGSPPSHGRADFDSIARREGVHGILDDLEKKIIERLVEDVKAEQIYRLAEFKGPLYLTPDSIVFYLDSREGCSVDYRHLSSPNGRDLSQFLTMFPWLGPELSEPGLISEANLMISKTDLAKGDYTNYPTYLAELESFYGKRGARFFDTYSMLTIDARSIEQEALDKFKERTRLVVNCISCRTNIAAKVPSTFDSLAITQ